MGIKIVFPEMAAGWRFPALGLPQNMTMISKFHLKQTSRPPTDINEAGWWSFYSNQILIRRATSKTIPCKHDFNHQQRATVSSGDWDQDAIQLVSGFRHVIAVIKLEGLLPVDIWSAKTKKSIHVDPETPERKSNKIQKHDLCRPWSSSASELQPT